MLWKSCMILLFFTLKSCDTILTYILMDNLCPCFLEYWIEGTGFVSYKGQYKFSVQSNSNRIRTILNLVPSFNSARVQINSLQTGFEGVVCQQVGLVGCHNFPGATGNPYFLYPINILISFKKRML